MEQVKQWIMETYNFLHTWAGRLVDNTFNYLVKSYEN